MKILSLVLALLHVLIAVDAKSYFLESATCDECPPIKSVCKVHTEQVKNSWELNPADGTYYTCACAEGYSGDGWRCEPTDECAESYPCPPVGSYCVDTFPTDEEYPMYKCGCNDGYKVGESDIHGAVTCLEVEIEPEEESKEDVEDEPEEESKEDVEDEPEEESKEDVEDEPEEESKEDVEDEPEEESEVVQTEEATVSKSCADTCTGNNKKCVEEECVCEAGYFATNGAASANCANENECQDGYPNECDKRRANCQDTEGSYTCNCKSGYRDSVGSTNPGTDCVDINECEEGTDTCADDQICLNKAPGFECVDPTPAPTKAPTKPPKASYTCVQEPNSGINFPLCPGYSKFCDDCDCVNSLSNCSCEVAQDFCNEGFNVCNQGQSRSGRHLKAPRQDRRQLCG